MKSQNDSPSASQPTLDRRSVLVGLLAGGTSAVAYGAGPELVDARFKRHPLLRVRIEMDIKGNVKIARNPLDLDSETDALPIESIAKLDYEERPLAPANVDPRSEIVAGERFYHEATSSSTLNKKSFEKTLRDPLRHVLVHRETLPETLYSPDNYFTQDELSLLRSPVSSLAVDHLLPRESITLGDRYEVDRDALCSVLNLTSIDSGTVESEVLEVTKKDIRFALKGEFEASVDGVGTRLRLLGKMTFQRSSATCTWLAMAVHETREIGKAEPGFDISATIRMVRRPMAQPVALPPTAAKVSFGEPVERRRLFVELRCREIEIGAMMHRNWRMIRDAPGSAVIRRIDHETSVAQCNLRSLVRLPEGSTLSLADFQADVRRTLGDGLKRLDRGDERVTAQGLRELRVVADGESEGVPLRWIMMHFSDEDGRRVQATFTMSADRVDQFAADDFQLADSLRFLETDDTGSAPDKEIASRANSPDARLADKDASSSPSDLD
ncbi:MAG: hypothetical protein AAFU85_03010 [Planctomycetota bacterium]